MRQAGLETLMRAIGAIFRYPSPAAAAGGRAMAGCDPIIHAGDVGTPDVLARLGALAPVHAVRGKYRRLECEPTVTQRIEIEGFRIYVLHILAELDPRPPRTSTR
jgi:predicted phosphodiesterase